MHGIRNIHAMYMKYEIYMQYIYMYMYSKPYSKLEGNASSDWLSAPNNSSEVA